MSQEKTTQSMLNEIALLTIESILKSPHVPTLEGKLKLIEYIVGAANQSTPELVFNV